MFEADYIPSEKPLFNVRLCTNKRLNTDKMPSCGGRGSREMADKIEALLLEKSIPAKLIRSPCMNNCQIGPNLKIQAAGLYNNLSDEQIPDIIAAIEAEVARRKAESETTT
jgi:(2Fe-2S) ferredoxin